MIEISLVQTHDEYRAVERIQRVVWGHGDLDVVPDHLLVTMQKNGGLVLGAFETLPEEGLGPQEEHAIGLALGFVGRSPAGMIKHCSHMVGVAPAYQNQNVGYRLKLAQREHVLAQGIDLITWTFDPLESRNARLNFRKLGGTCNTYLREVYGHMRRTQRRAAQRSLPGRLAHRQHPRRRPAARRPVSSAARGIASLRHRPPEPTCPG